MSIYRETLRLAGELRLIISGKVNDNVRDLVKAWARAWDEIEAEFAAAIDDLLALNDGDWPTLAQVARADRATRALEHAMVQLDGLTEFTGVLVVRSGSDAMVRAIDWQEHLVASQLPPSTGDAAAAAVIRWNRVSEYAIDAMVERLTQQIHSSLRPLSAEAVEAMKRALIRGIMAGDNPRDVAADILARVQGAFNGGLTRAMTIARTEILDAYRSGAAAAQFENAEVLQGWLWLAQLDSRTCPSCWAMHGSMHELTETGPDDHQNGRCARLPVAKPWADLGIDGVEEPPSVVPDAQAAFWAMPRSEQLAVMGPLRLAALESGVDWDLLSTRSKNPGWRDSYIATPARVLGRASIRLV